MPVPLDPPLLATCVVVDARLVGAPPLESGTFAPVATAPPGTAADEEEARMALELVPAPAPVPMFVDVEDEDEDGDQYCSDHPSKNLNVCMHKTTASDAVERVLTPLIPVQPPAPDVDVPLTQARPVFWFPPSALAWVATALISAGIKTRARLEASAALGARVSKMESSRK